jgi:HEAT repeat protein
MKRMRLFWACACLFGLLLPAVLLGQDAAQQASGPAQGVKSAAAGDQAAPTLAAAREQVAAGRIDEALASVNAVLARNPANRDAALLKTSTLLEQQRIDQALAAYDAFTAAQKKPDTAILASIARADLKRIVRLRSGDPVSLAGAFERLARSGDTDALKSLQREAASASSTPQEAQEFTVSLVRLGDKDAAARLGKMLDSAPSAMDKARMVRVLQDADARSLAPKAAALLGDPDPQVRAAAALAVGALQYSDGLPRLRAMFQDDAPAVRICVAVALKRLGQTFADTYLAGLLSNSLSEVRLIAAEGYQTSKSTQWVRYIKEVLTDRNEANRLRAAELLACCDQPAARSVLVPALESPILPLRVEAARILEATGLADPKAARMLLGESVVALRVHGAGAALRLAAAPAR